MSAWTNRPVFVTGGSGLVGGWLVDALVKAGADVTVLVRDIVPRSMLFGRDADVNVVMGDVRDGALVRRALHETRAEVVFHLAAQTLVETAMEQPAETFDVNVSGTLAVLEAARDARRWVKATVVASTDKVYGDKGGQAYDERDALGGILPYDASKVAAETLVKSYAGTYGLAMGITRCGNFFGPGDLNMSRIVPGTIRSVLHDEAPVIRSDGQYVRDYFYVKDGALAYMKMAEAMLEDVEEHSYTWPGTAYNFSCDDPLSVLAIVDKIQKRMMAMELTQQVFEPKILNAVRGKEIPSQVLSSARAREELDWEPTYTMDEALGETIAWYAKHFRGKNA